MEKNAKNAFRVPRKTNHKILEFLTDDGDQKQFLLTKIMESFKKPEISKSRMQFGHWWSIKNPEIETNYTKKRQSFKIKNASTMESYGFIYLKNEKELSNLAKFGKLGVGNVPDSKLATGKMGVSLSNFSDIFDPGTDRSNIPTFGILVIVKYMRGKVNYVTYDENPMEPQPKYDCHIVRNGNNLDSNATVYKAFHSTQVFLYEYDDDLDIVEYPSQLLIIGATSFTWSKNYIFKTQSDKHIPIPKVVAKRTLPESFTHDDPVPQKFSCMSSFSKLSKPNKVNEPVPIMSGNLIVSNSSANIKINVTLNSKFPEPVPLYNLLAPGWELTEVIRNPTFIEFFHYMDDKGSPSIVKVSLDRVTQLPPKFYDGKIVPRDGRSKHLIYLNMVPTSYNDKKNITKLIDHLSKSETVGRITTNFFPNVLFFLFPTGKISDCLGIPKDDGASLHVLLLYAIHPEIGCTNVLYRDEYIFIAETNTYRCRQEKAPAPLLSLDILKKESLKQQNQLKELPGKDSAFKSLQNSRQPNLINHATDSDMEVDSDGDKDKRKQSKPPNDSPIIKSPSNNLKDIPIRTPTTLPDSICFESLLNRQTVPPENATETTKKLTGTEGPMNVSHDGSNCPLPKNNQDSEANYPQQHSDNAQSSQHGNNTQHKSQHQFTLPPPIHRPTQSNPFLPPHSQTNHQPPQSSPHYQQPQFPPQHSQPTNCHPQSVTPDNLANHVQTLNPKNSVPVQCHDPSGVKIALQVSFNGTVPVSNSDLVSRAPHGHFKLISMTRSNNFIRRSVPRRPIRLPNLELMPSVSFISIFKG